MLACKAIWGSAERRGVPPRWRQAENAVVVEFCRLHQCRNLRTKRRERDKEPRELQRERERAAEKKPTERTGERDASRDRLEREREHEQWEPIVRRALQYKVSATVAVAPSHVESDLQEKPGCLSPTGAVIGALLPPPAREQLTRECDNTGYTGDILLAIFLTGDIIDWRYYAWRYYAGDISSVNLNNLV